MLRHSSARRGATAHLRAALAALLLIGLGGVGALLVDRASPAAAQPAAAAIEWRAPALTNATTLAAGRGYFAPALSGGRDYLITCPPGVRVGDLTLSGDPRDPPRNLVLIGCRSRGRLIARYFSGVAHIEGTWWQPKKGDDAIDCGGPAGPTGVCRIENTRATGISGSFNTTHADCIQPWGRIEGLQVDRFTCDTNYQGEFLAPVSWVGFAEERHVNLRHNDLPNSDGHPGVLFWVGESDQLNHGGPLRPLPFSCRWCYAKVRPDLTWAKQAIYPTAGATLAGAPIGPTLGEGGRALCWTAPMRTRGLEEQGRRCATIIAGDPPEGDFAPASLEQGYAR